MKTIRRADFARFATHRLAVSKQLGYDQPAYQFVRGECEVSAEDAARFLATGQYEIVGATSGATSVASLEAECPCGPTASVDDLVAIVTPVEPTDPAPEVAPVVVESTDHATELPGETPIRERKRQLRRS